MPLTRYFTFVGSLLLALLFVADWYLPKLIEPPAAREVDKRIIRLHSAHKWPEATVYDTSLPTIILPAASLPSAQTEVPTQAFAMVVKEMPSASVTRPKLARKPAEKRRNKYANAALPRLSSSERSMIPAGW